MFTATDWIRDKNGLMVLTPFPIKWAGKAAKQVYHKLRQKDTGNEATSRTFLQRKGSVLVQPLSLTSFDSSPSRGASGEEEKFSAMPKPPLQGATATTAASGGNREELLGPRPAGCERQRSRRWEPQPVGSSASKSLVVFWFSFDTKREQSALMKKRSNPAPPAREPFLILFWHAKENSA